MKKTMYILALTIGLALGTLTSYAVCQATTDTKVVFSDKDLENAVRKMAHKTKGTLYQKDVLKVKDLSLSGTKYDNLAGIENLKNLEELELHGVGAEDFTAISKLKKLYSLDITKAKLNTVLQIKGLTDIAWLSIRNAGITSIDQILPFIEPMKKMEILCLDDNQVNDFQALSCLRNMKALYRIQLNRNKIKDATELFKCVKKLPQKLEIQLNGNVIRTLWSGKESVINVKELQIAKNGMTSLNGIEKFSSLNVLDARNNKLTSIAPLKNLTKLTWLAFNNNKVRSLLPLLKHRSEKALYAENNPIRCYSPVARLIWGIDDPLCVDIGFNAPVVILNGKGISMAVDPYVYKKKYLFVPAKYYFQAMGYTYSYDTKSEKAVAKKGKKVVKFSKNGKVLQINKQKYRYPYKFMFKKNKLYVPLGFTTVKLGGKIKVKWGYAYFVKMK